MLISLLDNSADKFLYEFFLLTLLMDQIDILSELPGNMATKRLFYYPGAKTDGGKEGLIIQVRPSSGLPWIGIFALGTFGRSPEHNGIYSCPNPKSVCVVADRSAFLVNTENPQEWCNIPCYPVVDIKILPEHNILLFANYTEIIAWDKNGLCWKTERIALDGLTVEKIDDKFIYGMASCLCQSEESISHPFQVDINTGKHTGGWHGWA